MATFDELIPLYLKACEVEGKTARTVQSYAETLRQFRTARRLLELSPEIEAFQAAHVYLFLSWVRERGVTAGTQHRRQRETKAFFPGAGAWATSTTTPSCASLWSGASRK